jgi:NNP family nitrate/nitrite transporter-like MFS transporter
MEPKTGHAFPWLPLFLIVVIFYLNFISRIALAPLLPVVEPDLGIGHGEAGALFFYIASGYAAGLLGSGFVSSILVHRQTIALSAIMVGLATLATSGATSIIGIHTGLFFVGLFAGFYLPSGIATLTEIFPRELWGRAIAIHELGPNLGFVTVPLLSEALLRFLSWRGILGLIGIGSILMGVLLLILVRGGTQKGTPPSARSMRQVVSSPSFWTMITFFTVSIGASMGVYTMMPLFLVTEIGIERELANTYIGFSRVFGIPILFLSGFVTDRLGAKKAMMLFLIATGVFTFLLGFFLGTVITPVLLFLQAASVACLFPIGFTIMSLSFPSPLRSVAVSLVVFVGFLVGAGAIPAAIGHWAEAFSFSSGFTLLGILFLALLPLFLRLVKQPSALTQ